MCGRFALFESDIVVSRDFAVPFNFRSAPRHDTDRSQPTFASIIG